MLTNLSKMETTVKDGIANYFLPFNGELFPMNSIIGKEITLSHTGKINCIHCGIETPKSHNQGYCESCSNTLAKCDTCRVKPELCSYFEGGCRENSWGEENCLKDHLVYLSFTGSQKVGISRHSELAGGYSPRWIDQGATSAIPFIRVQHRLLSGIVEGVIRQHISDRTNWLKMLKLQHPDNNLELTALSLKEKVLHDIETLQQKYGLNSIQWIDNSTVKHIIYPVMFYPEKIKSVNLDKIPTFTSKLIGIKGQYLIFADGKVINFRKYSGYLINLSY